MSEHGSFGRLVLEAADDIYTVDPNALLAASAEFLRAAGNGGGTGLELPRRMAFWAREELPMVWAGAQTRPAGGRNWFAFLSCGPT